MPANSEFKTQWNMFIYSELLKCRHFVLMDILLRYGLHSYKQPCIITPEMWILCYSVKNGQVFSPTSTWTIQNSLINTDAHMPFKQDYPSSLLNSTTEHYNSTGTHSTSLRLWLAFLANVQREALECDFTALNCTSTVHTAKYTGSLQNTEASKIRTPPYCGHTVI